MWPLIPKDCNCFEEGSNDGVVCSTPYTTDDFYFNGINSICNDLQNGDDITTAIQKLQNFLCSKELTQYFLNYIEDNIEEFPEFITLINNAISCQTLTNCFTSTTTTSTSSTTSTTTSSTTSTSTTTSTSSTTTTTTTVAPVCTSYTLQSTITNGSWIGLSCENVPVAGITSFLGESLNTGCIFDTSLSLNEMTIVNQEVCIPTTTTTSSSTTSSTTTIAPTTTTTTTSGLGTTTSTTTETPGNLNIYNNTAGGVVTNLTEISNDAIFPVLPGTVENSNQFGAEVRIIVTVDLVVAGCVCVYINGILSDCQNAGAGVTLLTFATGEILSIDIVDIYVNDGEC